MQASRNTARNTISPDVSEDHGRSVRSPRRGAERLTSLPLLNLNASRAEFLRYFENSWELTETLFSCLKNDEAFYIRPYHKTRHPLVFYYTHPVCFYINKLLISGLIEEPVNPAFELLFETGVDEMNWDDLHDGKEDVWPGMDAIREYRQSVFNLVHNLISTHPCLDRAVTMDSPAWALVMAFEHERIHLETSSVLIRELAPEHISTPTHWPSYSDRRTNTANTPVVVVDYPENQMLAVAESEVYPGKPRDWPSFGWDNEYGQDCRQVAGFQASKFLISNGEFFNFVTAGGYESRKYWSQSGWDWRQFRNTKWPAFWVQDGPAGSHRYRLRTTFEIIDMQWDWPAVVNYYEARAYCAWLTETTGSTTQFRLPVESEHLAMRDAALRRMDPVGNDQPALIDPVMENAQTTDANLNLRFGSECPVNVMPANSQGFHDVMGNVWQWCEDTFHPLPQFSIHPYYTDFSTPCFDDEHQMILGGSFISTGDEASIWARFHFRPHFYQHAGFRVVQSMRDGSAQENKYETSEVVEQYLLFHYGSQKDQRDVAITAASGHPDTGDFVRHTAGLMQRFTAGRNTALDLGCAVGGASFELARHFNQVIGLDFSNLFIRAAKKMQRDGQMPYRRIETGSFSTPLQARVEEDIDRTRVNFIEGDACRLKQSLQQESKGPFDAILMANLLCRLPDPQACLGQFALLESWMQKNGILVIASPNTWSETYTSPDRFLDGANSEETLGRLAELLPGFDMLYQEDYPFMIREHRRKYEYIVSQISVWRKS